MPPQSSTRKGPRRNWLFGSLFFCDNLLQCAGATDCRGEADHRGADFWGKAKVPVKVTINDYTLRSTVDNRAVQQYIVVNADARWNAAVKVADVIPIFAGENDDTATGCGNG